MFSFMYVTDIDGGCFLFLDAFDEAKAKMGGLNVVCNNAAVNFFNADRRTRFDDIISINLVGTLMFF